MKVIARKVAAKEAADRRLAGVLSHLLAPDPVQTAFQAVDPTTRLLRSETGSVSLPNYSLPPLAEPEPEVDTELEDEGDSEHDSLASFAESDEDKTPLLQIGLCPTNHPLVVPILYR